MKRFLTLLAVALASAAVTYFLVGLRQPATLALPANDNLAWIRTEFGLNDEQFSAVRELHRAYAGVCAQHCSAIATARSELATVSTADRPAVEQKVRELEATCNEATRAHLHRVAAVMPPDQGERFLHMIEPHLAQAPHDGARGMPR